MASKLTGNKLKWYSRARLLLNTLEHLYFRRKILKIIPKLLPEQQPCKKYKI